MFKKNPKIFLVIVALLLVFSFLIFANLRTGLQASVAKAQSESISQYVPMKLSDRILDVAERLHPNGKTPLVYLELFEGDYFDSTNPDVSDVLMLHNQIFNNNQQELTDNEKVKFYLKNFANYYFDKSSN